MSPAYAGVNRANWLCSLSKRCEPRVCRGTLLVAYVRANGNAVTVPNAIWMYEEDFGISWKHTSETSSAPRSG